MGFIRVRHNIEVAHRLFEMSGNKCENIHGHSMWVELQLNGRINKQGLLTGAGKVEPYEFGAVKEAFRHYLDKNFDHHLLLNKADPFSQRLWTEDDSISPRKDSPEPLPGLHIVDGDPTTENIAKWIAIWASAMFQTDVFVDVAETHVNKAGVQAFYNSYGGAEVR